MAKLKLWVQPTSTSNTLKRCSNNSKKRQIFSSWLRVTFSADSSSNRLAVEAMVLGVVTQQDQLDPGPAKWQSWWWQIAVTTTLHPCSFNNYSHNSRKMEEVNRPLQCQPLWTDRKSHSRLYHSIWKDHRRTSFRDSTTRMLSFRTWDSSENSQWLSKSSIIPPKYLSRVLQLNIS